jgi:two-component system, OmpR family, KDP operon response regulator KdpE
VKTILLVDDEYAMIEVLGALLEEEGYALLFAANGLEALEILREKTPDLVVTDLMMPAMSGAELFRAMKKHPPSREVPVILMTSALKPTGADLRWTDFLSKPFELDDMLRSIRKALRKQPSTAT